MTILLSFILAVFILASNITKHIKSSIVLVVRWILLTDGFIISFKWFYVVQHNTFLLIDLER